MALAATLALSGCGGTGQDDGTASTSSTTFSGTAIDGYLARATVFLDSNNNGTRDAWEAFAFTDNEGFYSYNPNTDTNYCDSGASAQQAQYCLITTGNHSDIVVRIDGGYDVLTGEPFLGQMSRRVDATVNEEITESVVSPITSLLVDVESSTDRDSLLSSLGISESDLDVDYLDTDGAGSIDANLLNTALKIHKTVAILSDRLTDTYDEIGEDFGTPNDASSAVYPNLAEQIIAANTPLDTALADSSVLAGVLDGGGSARLPARLQRGQKIASSVGAGYDLGARLEELFLFEATPVKGKSLLDMEIALKTEIRVLQRELIDEQELARVKAQVLAHSVYEQDSLFYQAMKLGMHETVGLGWQASEAYMQKINQVTAEQVRTVAGKYLVESQLSIAYLEPQSMSTKNKIGANHAH